MTGLELLRAADTTADDERTAPGEEGLHPNLAEMYAREHRKARFILRAYAACGSTDHPSPEQNAPQTQSEF